MLADEVERGVPDPALQRSRMYGLLRRVFEREVDRPFLDWCSEQERAGLWSDLGLPMGRILESASPEDLLEELAVEFCRLFVTSGGAGSPHESVQMDAANPNGEPSLLMGDAVSAVKALYRKAGFALEEGAHRLPDTLSVELEFMERLTADEACAREAGDEDRLRCLQALQRRMLDQHLVLWLPPYGEKLESAARTDFYRSMLNMAVQFVKFDFAEIGGHQGD